MKKFLVHTHNRDFRPNGQRANVRLDRRALRLTHEFFPGKGMNQGAYLLTTYLYPISNRCNRIDPEVSVQKEKEYVTKIQKMIDSHSSLYESLASDD